MENYRHKGLRKSLVKILIKKGITNKRVLQAINTVPRHLFLDKAFEEWAYKDQAIPITANQTISHPYTVAFQTELLDPQPEDKILEIGTGSGYQACILAVLCKKIYSIERQVELFKETNTLLQKIGFNKVRTLYGDGYLGSPRFAPFDKVLVTAGASEVPKTLLEQLKIGGFLVIPVGEGDDKKMLKIIKHSEEKYTQESHGIFRFVPFKKGVVK